jgi:hypothetical protein
MTPKDEKRRLDIVRLAYTALLDLEENMGWPGDEPFWGLRQLMNKILKDAGVDNV